MPTSMRSPIRSISALSAVFIAAIGIAACGGVSGNEVAKIEGTSVTKSAFDHWMTIAAASVSTPAPGQKAPKPVVPQPPSYSACIAHLRSVEPKPAKGQPKQSDAALKSQCEQQYTLLKQRALSYLITSTWIYKEAEAMKLHVSDKEVQKEFIKLKNARFPKKSEFAKFLEGTHETVSDLLANVKSSMLQKKIEEKIFKEAKKKISKAEAQKYYREHESSFGQPEKRNLRIILTSSEAKAKAAKGEVESGKSFASVAKRVSIDPVSKAKGGVLEGVTKGQQQKALNEAVFSAKTGVLSGPVKTPFGYYVFEVTRVLPGSSEAFSKVESRIKQEMGSEREHKALEKFAKEYKKRWTAKTECRSGYVVQDCKGYKEPKAPSTPTPPSTSKTTSSSSTTSSKSK